MTKPMLIRQSPMTRCWYAFTNYEWLDAEHNALVIKGQKRDVTGEIERIIAEIEEQIAKVSTGEANGWISVEERLPDKYTTVLVLRNGEAHIQEFCYDGEGCGGTHQDHKDCDCGNWWWCEPYGDGTIDENCYNLDGDGDSEVTHWQPLPPAPTSVPQAEPQGETTK